MLALLGMLPTGFGSLVVNVPISAAPADKPPVLTEKSRWLMLKIKVPFSGPGRATLNPLTI